MPTRFQDKLVKIIWRDICGTCRWFSRDNAIDWADRAYALNHTTVGFMLYGDDRYVVVAATRDTEDEYNDVSMIPRASVKKITKLGE